MPISNLNNVHLSAEQVAQAQSALSQLEQVLTAVNINLTPDERQKYGSVNEQNKLFINKVRDYNVSQPTLSASEIEWSEFNADYQSRTNYEAIISRLLNLVDRLNNAKPCTITTITSLPSPIMHLLPIRQGAMQPVMRPS